MRDWNFMVAHMEFLSKNGNLWQSDMVVVPFAVSQDGGEAWAHPQMSRIWNAIAFLFVEKHKKLYSQQSWVNARLVHSVHWNEWENNSLLFTTHTNKSHGNKSGFLISSAMTHKVESANDCMHPAGVLFSLWCCWQQLDLQWPKCWRKKSKCAFSTHPWKLPTMMLAI